MPDIERLCRPAHVGNDVVDLTDPEAPKRLQNQRFVERVFTRAEREWMMMQPLPWQELWSMWSAKEAAFKLASKCDPGLVFSHRQFEVDAARGLVRFRDDHFFVRWSEASTGALHCVACHDSSHFAELRIAVGRVSEVECDVLTDAERASAYSPAAIAARCLAKSLIGARCEIIRKPAQNRAGFGPPQIVLEDHAPSAIDVSLSHDRHFAAAVVLGNVPRERV